MPKKMLFGVLAASPLLLGQAKVVINKSSNGINYHASTEGGRSCLTAVRSKTEIEALDLEVKHKLQQLQKKNKKYIKSTVVDLHYHIIVCSDGTGTVTDQQIDDQTTVLNAAYATTGFSFVEKSRSVVVNNDWCTLASSSSESDMKNALRRGDASTLNFYSLDTGDTALGWAYFPDNYSINPVLDGVVNKFSTLPPITGQTPTSYGEGDTAVHEVGHWLGLHHTFNDGCSGGDEVADTPAVASPNYGCPAPGTVLDSCNNGIAELWMNFMDYTDDACMDSFTLGQITRMQDQWNAYRTGTSCFINCGTSSPTISPAPTIQCFDVTVIMYDSYGDGWNGNTLYFDSVDMENPDLHLTLDSGSDGTATVCLTPGIYYPFGCGGGWPEEVSWEISGYDFSGGATADCNPGLEGFTVLGAGATLSPTAGPTPVPTITATIPGACEVVTVEMTDTYGDGWNGNFLYFDAEMTLKVTMDGGDVGSTTICLPKGVTYEPYACSGSWQHEVGWCLPDYGICGGADSTCSASSGTFSTLMNGQSGVPTTSPTMTPTVTPTSTPTMCNVVVTMYDSYGDGWNGNYMYFDDVANMVTTVLKMTMEGGSEKTQSICLDPGVYHPFACGGPWAYEVSWFIHGYGLTGGADDSCTPTSGSFEVGGAGSTQFPTLYPSIAPSIYPSVYPSPYDDGDDDNDDEFDGVDDDDDLGDDDFSGGCCCDAKIDAVLSNQDTMLGYLTGSGPGPSSSVDESDAVKEDASSSSSHSPSSPSTQISLESTTVILATVASGGLFTVAAAVAIFYRRKAAAMEAVLARNSLLSDMELSAY